MSLSERYEDKERIRGKKGRGRSDINILNIWKVLKYKIINKEIDIYIC